MNTRASALTVKETGERLGFTPYGIRDLIHRGELRAFRMGLRGQWRIPLDEVERHLNVEGAPSQSAPSNPSTTAAGMSGRDEVEA